MHTGLPTLSESWQDRGDTRVLRHRVGLMALAGVVWCWEGHGGTAIGLTSNSVKFF